MAEDMNVVSMGVTNYMPVMVCAHLTEEVSDALLVVVENWRYMLLIDVGSMVVEIDVRMMDAMR
jgi:hypothetical protein